MSILTNNRLIAGFDENAIAGKYPSREGKGYFTIHGKDYEKSECDLMEYHTSWEWLMPVVEKIESGFHWNHEIHIHNGHCKITKFNDEKVYMGNSKIEAIYKAVVEFIKWYENDRIGKEIGSDINKQLSEKK